MADWCEKCSSWLMDGMDKCGSCGHPVPKPAPPPELNADGTKDCPFCAEPIKAAAAKCKHCGSWLDGRAAAGQAPKPQIVMPRMAPLPPPQNFKKGVSLGAGILIGFLICGFAVGVLYVLAMVTCGGAASY